MCKVCNKCKIIKDIDQYSKNKWGPIAVCKSCKAAYTREYNKNNPDKKKQMDKDYYIKNSEYIKERVKEYSKQHMDKLRPKKLIRTIFRRLAKLHRTPIWLTPSDLLKIKAIYDCSNRLSKCLGIPHHVDHIIPLQGKTVSGLHVPNNLQVIPASINLSKGNSYGR